jgi:cell division septal protein FtsQ
MTKVTSVNRQLDGAIVASLQRTPRRSAPRRTNRRLHTVLSPAQTSTVMPAGLAGVWSAQRPKIAAAALALLIIGALFEFFNGDAFYVFSLDVTGTQYLPKTEVVRASGILGYNIFFIDARQVEQTLEKLPEVSSVHVTTGLPNRVSIQVVERVPTIAWLRGNEMYWVDDSGLVFRARANLPQLPSIRDLDQAVVKPGQPAPTQAFAAYRALFAAWSTAPHAFEWSAARGLAYTDEHGWRIYLGDASEMAGKLAKLHAVVARLVSQNAHIQFIDLSKGDPFYQ